MGEIEDIIKNPYSGINISILATTIDFEQFKEMCESLFHSSSNFNDVEMLLKVDDLVNIDKYHEYLSRSIFKYKILIYPSFYKRMSCFHFYNDLYGISSGKLIWAIGSDCGIAKGDWHKSLSKFINKKIYKDNIYNIAVPMDNGKGYKQICGINIVTREWCEIMGCLSPLPNIDRWLSELSKKIGRHQHVEEDELLSHYPQGRRSLSKKQRKEIYRPMLVEAIKTFKKRLK